MLGREINCFPRWSTYENYYEYPGGRTAGGGCPLVSAGHERPARQRDDGPDTVDGDWHYRFRGWDWLALVFKSQETNPT